MNNKETKDTILVKAEIKTVKGNGELPDFTIKKVGTPTILSLLLDLKDLGI